MQWGNYTSGTYTLDKAIVPNSLLYIQCGVNGRYTYLSIAPSSFGSEEILSFITNDGYVQINFIDSIHINVIVTGSTNLRIIQMSEIY